LVRHFTNGAIINQETVNRWPKNQESKKQETSWSNVKFKEEFEALLPEKKAEQEVLEEYSLETQGFIFPESEEGLL
jgi:hypothetical protein